MKDGSTYLAHNADYVVDMGDEGHGAIQTVVRHDANRGDTNTILEAEGDVVGTLDASV